MTNYEKPIVLANSELSEGVYAASGRRGCFSPHLRYGQYSNGCYMYSLVADHNGEHHSSEQKVVITFATPITGTVTCYEGTLNQIDSTTIEITYSKHVEDYEQNVDFGTLFIRQEENPVMKSIIYYCNRECSEHTL